MLKKILKINGLGLLHGINTATTPSFAKIALIYAENGTGKSTFASLMRSCGLQDSSPLDERRTIGETKAPTADLLFDSGNCQLSSGKWQGAKPKIIVYDAEFVESNVHAGNEVTPAQRANLLNFALGTSAVEALREQEQATEAEKVESATSRAVTKEIEASLEGVMPLSEFRSLQEDPQIDSKIAEAEHDVSALRRAAQIRQQPQPQEFSHPTLDVTSIFGVLGKTLESVHVEAAAQVAEHVAALQDTEATNWVRRGTELQHEDICPFCGQSTSGVGLVEMYKHFFDAEYEEFEREIAKAAEDAKRATDSSVQSRLEVTWKRNIEVLEAWKEFIEIPNLDDSEHERAYAALRSVHDSLTQLFDRKGSSLSSALPDDGEREGIEREWGLFTQIVRGQNEIVARVNERIDERKAELGKGSLELAEKELTRLRTVRKRFDPSSVSRIQRLVTVESELEKLRGEKMAAREELENIMAETLKDFREDINTHLEEFGAAFSIAEISHNYRGGAPRAEYQLVLRNIAIPLSGGSPTFATALSEGDKRTMGFAFFAASTLGDPDLSEKIVVVDDPMSSLDRERRDQTAKVIVKIAEVAKQVIVLAHDPYFLRGVRSKAIQGPNGLPVSEHSIVNSAGNNSAFVSVSLDELCQSDYLRNYKRVTDIAAGKTRDPSELEHGAISMRVLLEGYLHRKYPEAISPGVTLGTAIEQIRESEGTDSPCAPMAKRADELKELNDYVSKFHHDTYPDYDAARRESQRTLKKKAQDILHFIHSA